MKREEKLNELRTELPKLQNEFLKLVKKEKQVLMKYNIRFIFTGDLTKIEDNPLGIYIRYNIKLPVVRPSDSSKFLRSIVEKYTSSSLFLIYEGQFAHKQGSEMFWWHEGLLRSWNSAFIYYNFDTSEETQYYVLIKINNLWYRIIFSTKNEPSIQKYKVAYKHFQS